jgi:hypothetical protein
MEFALVEGCRMSVSIADDVEILEHWKSGDPAPVPILLARPVWQTLCESAQEPVRDLDSPIVFRLFMMRGQARHVVSVSRIKDTWVAPYGVTRWKEGGYPGRREHLRKGGNAFVRMDPTLRLSDVWWMASEETDLRIIIAPDRPGHAKLGAWWVRGSDSQKITGRASGRYDTQGTPLPVWLFVEG